MEKAWSIGESSMPKTTVKDYSLSLIPIIYFTKHFRPQNNSCETKDFRIKNTQVEAQALKMPQI